MKKEKEGEGTMSSLLQIKKILNKDEEEQKYGMQ